jgi:AcrR family transcriptional regulator
MATEVSKSIGGNVQPPKDDSEAPRERLLAAAYKLFSQRGYPGTSTRDLAAAAGVTERTLFRHFPTKVMIFRAAVVQPFHQAIVGYVERWEQYQHGIKDPLSEMADLFHELFDVLIGHRGMVQALMAAEAFEPNALEADDPDGIGLADLLGRLQTVMEVEARTRGWKLDAEVTIRLLFGMLMSTTVHANWLFNQPPPSRDRMLAELAALGVYGMSARP